MIRGLYAAGSGMLAETTRTDVVANNLANASTPGYMKDIAVSKDFRNMMIQRINDGPDRPNIGSLGVGAVIDEIATIHTRGGMRATGNKFDMAIEGAGYFVVETPAGLRYTRNGNFTRSSRGELVTQDGYRVLGQRGPIQLGNTQSRVEIAEDGRVMVNNIAADRLRVVTFANENQLVKEGASLFAPGPGQQEQAIAGSVIRTGFIEVSNVNVVTEMVNLINGLRAYEINSQAIHAHDQMLDKAVNQVAQV